MAAFKKSQEEGSRKFGHIPKGKYSRDEIVLSDEIRPKRRTRNFEEKQGRETLFFLFEPAQAKSEENPAKYLQNQER